MLLTRTRPPCSPPVWSQTCRRCWPSSRQRARPSTAAAAAAAAVAAHHRTTRPFAPAVSVSLRQKAPLPVLAVLLPRLQTVLPTPAVVVGQLVSRINLLSAGVGPLPSSDRISRRLAGAVMRVAESLLCQKGLRSAAAAGAARLSCQTKSLAGRAAKSGSQRVHLLLGPGLYWFHCARRVGQSACLSRRASIQCNLTRYSPCPY